LYMERIKSEYLQKILDQVNHQNIEYFENLTCEYTLQLKYLLSGGKPIKSSGLQDDDIHNISFINKPEIIKMHLDILYKSIGFLNQDRINAMLETYK